MALQTAPRVVVVDDEEGVLRLCQRVLERAGFEVKTFSQPYRALDYFQEHEVDVLVVDTRMPEMNGFVLMKQARLRQPNLAVVMMTGFASLDMALEALNSGADGLLLKPFEKTDDLVEKVWQGLSNRRTQEENARVAALRPLFEVTETLLSETHLAPLQQLIVEKVSEFMPSIAVGLYWWNADGSDGSLLASTGEVPRPEELLAEGCEAFDRPWVVHANSPAAESRRALLRRYGWYSLLVAPVERGGRRYAILVAREQPPLFHPEVDTAALGILARISAAALENARLYEALRESLEKLKRSQQALALTEKMAAIGRLTASLAHEVNNPIQAIRNSLYLAAHPNIDEPRRQKYLQGARQEVERLSSLVHQMLNFYRPGNVERQIVHFKPLVERVVELLRAQLADQQIEVEVDVPENLPPVVGVEDQLQQVVLNLVLNAMEAMLMGGKLYLFAWAEDDQVILAVEDTGPGVPEHLRERIFEPLVSTKEDGTGLGLAVSYNILVAHRGELRLAEPRRGSGAAFHMVLPVAEAGETAAKQNSEERQ